MGLVTLVYGFLTVLSSFQTNLELHLTSGTTHRISVVIFEKANLLSCKDTIEKLILRRYDDTNVTANTDRVIDALNKK